MPCLGTFEVENKLWPFYADDYCFSIMSPAPTYDFWNSSVIKPENGFLFGKSYHKNNIAIQIDQEIQTGDYIRIKTDSFVYSSSITKLEEFKSFKRIRFQGGVLDAFSFNPKNTLKEDAPPINEKIDFSIVGTSPQGKEVKMFISIYSVRTNSYTVNSNITYEINNCVEIIFDNNQPLNNVFWCYETMKKISVLLTGFQDVYFNQIDISHKIDDFFSSQLYIKENKKQEDLFLYNSITFDCLGKYTKELFALAFNEKSKKSLPSLDFLPSQAEAWNINANFIRNICSAVEHELQYIDVSGDEKEKIKILIKEVKKIIEENKKGENQLQEKTYSLIEGSMSHWDMSLSDKIEKLRTLMKWEFNFIQDRLEDRNDISVPDFVLCRNKITHKSNYEISKTVKNTGLVLRSIIRCCVLKRIGVPQDTILDLCKNRKV